MSLGHTLGVSALLICWFKVFRRGYARPHRWHWNHKTKFLTGFLIWQQMRQVCYLETLSAMAFHVLTQIRSETTEHSANITSYHGLYLLREKEKKNCSCVHYLIFVCMKSHENLLSEIRVLKTLVSIFVVATTMGRSTGFFISFCKHPGFMTEIHSEFIRIGRYSWRTFL